MSPEGTQVVVLGDGEFDGTTLQATLNEAGWVSVCRTAQSTVCTWEGESFRLDTLGACLQPGSWLSYARSMSHVRRMVPSWLCCWARGIKSPYICQQPGDSKEAWGWYQKRFRIETFSQTRKAEGSYSEVTHIRPPRLSRLLIAACCYIWIVYLGALGRREMERAYSS